MKKIIFTDEQIQDILEKYKNNWTQTNIGKEYGVSKTVIKRVLEEQQAKFRQTTSKYKANYDIFENIDTPEKAYWLGFIAADGCNYRRERNASIIINIHQKDMEQLEKFKEFCETDAIIYKYSTSEGYSRKSEMCKITLNSKKMSNDLIDKGIIPNKSLILKPPKIDEKYYLPFILGYFDGDGSIGKTSQYSNYSFSLQGTKEMLQWINKILQIDLPLEKRTNTEKNSYYIRCGGTNKPYQILKQLYQSCNVHLKRKYNIYKTLETVVLSRNAE